MSGWFGENRRHALSAKGIKSGNMNNKPGIFRLNRYKDGTLRPQEQQPVDTGLTMNPYNGVQEQQTNEQFPQQEQQIQQVQPPQAPGMPQPQEQNVKSLDMQYKDGQVKRVKMRYQ